MLCIVTYGEVEYQDNVTLLNGLCPQEYYDISYIEHLGYVTLLISPLELGIVTYQ